MALVSTRQVSSNLILIFLMLLTSFYNLGNVYIADTYNHRVRKITISTGLITTIAGTGTAGYTSDNVAATSTTLKYPRCVALDSSGNILINTSTDSSVLLLSSF